jgi:site-specific recombinase XerD
MLTKFFKSPVRVGELRDGRAGPLLEGFAQQLYQTGYAEVSARAHILAAEHFTHWIDRKAVAVATLNDSIIDGFGHHLHRCRSPRYGHTRRINLQNGARLFLGYLRGAGVVTSPMLVKVTQEPVLLTEFHQWMHQQRGTSGGTLQNYSRPIRDLLKTVGDPSSFDALRLRKFVLQRSKQSGWGRAKICTTGVRMFLRFLIAEGKCAVGLDAVIPTLAHWRLSSLPRYLQSEEVERVIASCDRATPVGRRDRAILLLLARMGFRAGDVVGLRLGDLDWEQAWIDVSGKGQRQSRLPMTQEVGDAIAAYVQNGRPAAVTDTLFVRSHAPFRGLSHHCAVSSIVVRAMRRAGVTCPSRGAAHVLRHSVATSMLRQGASLQEIAVILRHRSIQTTEIYAKVDVTSLREIAQPWPEVELC